MPKLDLDKALHALEITSKVGIFGYSDRISMGILAAIFKNIEKDACYQYINLNKSLWDGWGEYRWDMIRRISNKLEFDKVVTVENAMAVIERDRPDLATIFKFHPQGKAWLESQITELKQRLRRQFPQ